MSALDSGPPETAMSIQSCFCPFSPPFYGWRCCVLRGRVTYLRSLTCVNVWWAGIPGTLSWLVKVLNITRIQLVLSMGKLKNKAFLDTWKRKRCGRAVAMSVCEVTLIVMCRKSASVEENILSKSEERKLMIFLNCQVTHRSFSFYNV